MAGHAGLVQKKVNVRTKKGKTVQRSMWVRAQGAAKGVARFVGRHKGKIAAGAALVGAAALAAHHRGGIAGAARGLHHGIKQAREHGDRSKIMEHLRKGAGVGHASDVDRRGSAIGKAAVGAFSRIDRATSAIGRGASAARGSAVRGGLAAMGAADRGIAAAGRAGSAAKSSAIRGGLAAAGGLDRQIASAGRVVNRVQVRRNTKRLGTGGGAEPGRS